jgi:hypothetical protein
MVKVTGNGVPGVAQFSMSLNRHGCLLRAAAHAAAGSQALLLDQ